MNTPIVDFVREYNKKEYKRLHMPGHKGRGFLGFEQLDITEIKGADALFEAESIIRDSEMNAERLFDTAVTAYSCEGSSLCIRAMLSLLRGRDGKILAARNAHKAFIYGAALMDYDVKWLYSSDAYSLCSCNITAEDVENALKNERAKAVYVTSPDYLGNMLDIRAISHVCHKYGVPLIVDNAHGSYLAFLDESCHPIHLGADMCCDSAHKTLPVLTGGAYLHLGKNSVLDLSREDIKAAMELFASTSPSYLILQSLDMANDYISKGYREKLKNTVLRLNNAKKTLVELGYEILPSDPLKLTIASSEINLAELLREQKIECEYEDPDFTVMMFTPENAEDIDALVSALKPIKLNKNRKNYALIPPKKAMSLREALFSEKESVRVEEAVGRICAGVSIACPPAVPVVVCGERISENTAEIMRHYGITHCSVVLEK